MLPRYFFSPEAMDRLARGEEADLVQTGAMIALVPTDDTVEMLAVPGYEPAEQLHVTLEFLGLAADWDRGERLQLAAALSMVAKTQEPLQALLFATATFNPTTNPCSCYLLNGEDLDDVEETVDNVLELLGLDEKVPDQHEPWIPHIAIGYGLDDDALSYAGRTITLDRLRLSFADSEVYDFPLSGPDDGDDDTPTGVPDD